MTPLLCLGNWGIVGRFNLLDPLRGLGMRMRPGIQASTTRCGSFSLPEVAGEHLLASVGGDAHRNPKPSKTKAKR